MKKQAFTLAQVMIILLLVAIFLAMTVPVLTKALSTKNLGKTWTKRGNYIHYGYNDKGDTSKVVIGSDNPDVAQSKAKLIINNDKEDEIPMMLNSTFIQQGTVALGTKNRLYLASTGTEQYPDINAHENFITLTGGAISGNNSIAIGGQAFENGISISGTAPLNSIGFFGFNVQASSRVNEVYIGDAIVQGNFVSNQVIDYSSDIRLKENISKYTNSIDTIKKIKPYNFVMKNDPRKTPRVGVMAQDLRKIIPEAVSAKGDKKKTLVMNADYIFYTIVNAIKELCVCDEEIIKENQEIAKKIAELEKEIDIELAKLK